MKKILFSLTAIFAAVIVWAFVSPNKLEHKAPMLTTEWFVYIGDGNSYDEPEDYVFSSEPPSCPGATDLCAIQVTSDGMSPQRPDESALDAIQSDINAALAGTPKPNVGLKN